jgi:uncharacterized protein YbjT (DUF2867 family)
MRVLLTGANGFIGRYLLSALIQAGHEVVPAVRRPAETDRLLARPASVRIDFNHATEPREWMPHLAGIDAVINCAGILQARPGQSIDAIHAGAPIALFRACEASGIRRLIQISAISAEAGAGTHYAATKHAADAYLATTGLDWVILRPSLIYAQGAQGGTALFRAIAALPLFTPLPGDGQQRFQPIHMDDLTGAVVRILADPAIRHVTIDPVGPEPITLRQLFADLRQWLGFAPVLAIPVPMPVIRLAARLGDVAGGSLNSTAIRQVEFGNTGPVEPFAAATGIRPRGWKAGLHQQPAQTQDRWHARLYFVRPVLRTALALFWLATGLSQGMTILGIVALAIGVAVLLLPRRPLALAAIQVAAIILLAAGLRFTSLPILAAVLTLAAIESDR